MDSLELDKSKIPVHVGIIMDGNGRWAKKRNLLRTNGHNEGLKRAKEMAKAARDIGVKFVTLYVFSTENWKRTEQEVGFLMNLIHTHLKNEFKFYQENGIRVRLLGDRSGLPESIQKDIDSVEQETNDFDTLTLNLAINYGGRNEIVRSVKKIIESNIKSEDISEKLISDNFDIKELPDVDLLIRTGGEKRLSNFLLWHAAYAEFLFTDTLWPDYKENEFYENIREFQSRSRRFGAVPV